MYQPLKGVKVLDFCLAGSGPSATKLLCEFGAEVIWVEPLTGSSTRDVHKYDFYTTGKRAIALNLKTEKGMEAMRRLIAGTDVFVTNYRPKAVKKLGLDYETLKKDRPDLIYAVLTGFGTEGEEANDAGYDPVAYWAKGGMLVDIAEKGTLVVPPIAVGDISTGGLLFGGIAAALYGKEKTGEGCQVMCSLLSTAIYINHDAIVEVQYGEKYPKSRLEPRRPLNNTYQCSDGKWFVLSLFNQFDRYFNRFLTEVIDRPDLVGKYSSYEDTMKEHSREFTAILDEAFSKMTRDEAIRRLKSIDAPVNIVQTTEEVMKDPQALANKYLYKIKATVPPADSTDGEIVVPASPIKFNNVDSGTERHERGPKIGEHTIEILKEYGYADEDIQQMLNEGAAGSSK